MNSRIALDAGLKADAAFRLPHQWAVPAATDWLMGEMGCFVVPARDKRALRFLVDHLFLPHNRWEWICARLLRRGIWLPNGRGFFRQPWRVRISSRAAFGDGSLSRAVEALSWLRRELCQAMETDNFSWILLRDHPSANRKKATLFLFRGEDRSPIAILKLRPAGAGRWLHREWEALRYLDARLPRELAAALPVPVFFDRRSGMEVLLLRFVPGRPLAFEIAQGPVSSKRMSRHFATAAAWLACFQVTTRTGRILDLQALPVGTDLRLVNQGEHGAELRFWLDRLKEMRLRLPLAASHGDFWARNLLTRRRYRAIGGPRLEVSGVVDWEHFSAAAPPWGDLFHFALTYGLNYPWRPYGKRMPADAFRLAFLEDNALSRAVRTGFSTYCDLTGTPFEALRPLFHLFLWRSSCGDGQGAPWLVLHRLLGRRDASAFRPLG